MNLTYLILFLHLYFHLLPFANEQMLTFPKLSEKSSNPIDEIIIFQPGQEEARIQISEEAELSLKVIKNFTQYYDSYFINPNLFFFVDEANNHYSLAENKFYTLTLRDGDEIFSTRVLYNLPTDVQYSNYIQAKKYTVGMKMKDISALIVDNEVILYVKKGQYLYFYYTAEKVGYEISVGNIDDQVSCKLVNGATNVCAISENGQIKLNFFVYIYQSTSSKEISKKHEETITEFYEHENPILYDTENSEYKTICANKKTDKSIQCS